MVSALDYGSNGPGWSLGRGITLCSWARHFTLTVPLFTQVYKWVPAYLMLGLPLRWTGIPSRREQKYSQSLQATETGISSHLTGQLARTQTLPSGPILDRYQTDTWPILGRYVTDTWPILQRRSIATYRPIYRPTAYRNIGRLATDYRPTIGRYIGRLSVNYLSTIDRQSTDISTETTCSTHDPNSQMDSLLTLKRLIKPFEWIVSV